MPSRTLTAVADSFPRLEGEMAARVRGYDWMSNPLGPISSWPLQLKTVVSLMLAARQPMFIAWGPQRIWLYNDAFIPIAGHKHPQALGLTAGEMWAEIRGDIGPLFAQVFAGKAVQMDEIALKIERGGVPEECHFSFGCTPVLAEDGSVAGLFGTCLETTAKVFADRERRRTEERLRFATENAGIGLWEIDSDQNIAFFYARDAFSMPQDRKTSWEEFLTHVHPEDAAALRIAYAAARDPHTRGSIDIEYRTLAMERSPARWVAVNGRGVFDANGRCVGLSGTAVDITRRKQAELKLRQSEETLRLATESAEVGLWDMDVVNNTNHPDARVKAMFGLSPDTEQDAEDYFAQVHPEDVDRVLAAYRAAYDSEKRPIYEVEYRVLGKDGVLRWICAKGRGLFNARGTCIRVIGTAIDVTREKQIAEALRRSEEQLRLATEFADVGFWDMDVRDDRLYWPPRVNMMFGLPPEALVTPKQFRAFLHQDDRRRVVAATLAACDPQIRAPYDIEYRIVRGNDGAVRWMAARGRAIFAEDGTCVRMLGIVLDVTERKEIERQVHELNDTLERRVGERTAALEKSQAQIRLAEQALQQAQKMEAIGNLTGGIAHDFNNLLQGVAGSLDLIRRKPEDVERVRRWVEMGLQAAQRGAKLTGQLLAFSRSQKLELRPIDLAALLTGMRDLLGRTLGRNIAVRIEPDPHAGNVMGDNTQIELAVLNLAINARDAMPEGGILTITTRAYRAAIGGELAPGDYVEVAVMDTGTGMPAEVAARAFDPFFTTKGVGKGTGLGLSQVYGMARQAGGIARIQSQAGRGTTVSMFLRRTEAAVQPDPEHTSIGAEPRTASATILVIDDDPDVRRFLADTLDSLGFAVVQAEDGPAGLAAFARHPPDLVILDYAMPGMTGAEVAQTVRAHTKDLPILFATGYADTKALDSVAEDAMVLRKPFGVDELQRAVRGALGR